MPSISYPLSSNTLTDVLSLHDAVCTGNEMFNVKMGEDQFFLEKNNGINKVLDELCKHGWVNPSANYQDTNLHNLLSSLAETSLAERMIGFDNALKCGLPPGYNATFCFEDNGQSGVKMHYGRVHSNGYCDLFKLTCDFLFDKNCQLSHEKSFISIECFPQCPKALEDALDSRTVIKVFLDWLMNLFHLNGSMHEGAKFVAAMEKNIEVNFSKGNINQDNSGDSVIESRTNGKYENDRHKLFEKNSHEFDEITHYINNELDECSEKKIEQMMKEFSANIDNEIENDEQDLKQLEIDSVKFTQDFAEINDEFEHRSKDDFEWDDAI
ncbi:TPA: hypothetical protein PXO92_003312 [Yersinia enterocolitica]|nr:hypothetical protein [Yersinia enterocolitica]